MGRALTALTVVFLVTCAASWALQAQRPFITGIIGSPGSYTASLVFRQTPFQVSSGSALFDEFDVIDVQSNFIIVRSRKDGLKRRYYIENDREPGRDTKPGKKGPRNFDLSGEMVIQGVAGGGSDLEVIIGTSYKTVVVRVGDRLNGKLEVGEISLRNVVLKRLSDNETRSFSIGDTIKGFP